MAALMNYGGFPMKTVSFLDLILRGWSFLSEKENLYNIEDECEHGVLNATAGLRRFMAGM